MKRPAYDQTSLTHCKICSTKLDKNKLKGNLCMQCASKKNTERRRLKRQCAIELLGDKCKDCSKTYPAPCYDFHHKDEKEVCVSILIHRNRKLETILNEAAKCELLCANCHRLRHFS
jgi:hypothetical protein